MSTVPRQPVAKVRLGAITFSIWENSSEDGRIFYSFTLQRSYQDQYGVWQNTETFRASDAMAIITGTQDAFRWISTEGKRRAKEQGAPDDATVDVPTSVATTEQPDVPFS